MSDGAFMQITGTAAVNGRLNLKKGEILERCKMGVRSGLLLIVNDAKIYAPYRTGNLRRSIHDEEVIHKDKEISGKAGSNVHYAKRMEYGGSKQAPDGFLRKSLDENKDRAMAEIVDAIKEVLR